MKSIKFNSRSHSKVLKDEMVTSFLREIVGGLYTRSVKTLDYQRDKSKESVQLINKMGD